MLLNEQTESYTNYEDCTGLLPVLPPDVSGDHLPTPCHAGYPVRHSLVSREQVHQETGPETKEARD